MVSHWTIITCLSDLGMFESGIKKKQVKRSKQMYKPLFILVTFSVYVYIFHIESVGKNIHTLKIIL